MSGIKLSSEEMVDLEDKIADVYGDFSSILNHINTKGKIEDFLKLIDHTDFLGKEGNSYETFKNGKVIVLGDSSLNPNDVIRALRDAGLQKERIEVHLGYDLGGYNVERSLKYDWKISLVLIGPVPHSMHGKGQYPSIIEMMEREQGYPPVIRLTNNGAPKITKTNLKNAVAEAINKSFLEL